MALWHRLLPQSIGIVEEDEVGIQSVHVTPFLLHAPRSVALADCFSILLGAPIEVRDHLNDVGLLRLRQFCIDWNRHHLFGRLF